MNKTDKEVEVKFYLLNLAGLETRLIRLGADLHEPRVFETNLRFDLPDGSLTRAHQVLRLRSDRVARLTYKGPADMDAAVSVRQEIEVTVSDFAATRRLLEALGYRISVMYEKFRTTYRFNGLEVVLDEMPFGNFCEIEGGDAPAIQAAAAALGLDWEARITESYLALFDRVNAASGRALPHLTFAAFAGQVDSAALLGVRPADHP